MRRNDKWSDNWLEIPNVYEASINNYFVLRMKTKRPMRSAEYVDDRHVSQRSRCQLTLFCTL